MMNGPNNKQNQNSLLNFKIAKCKNWEKDGTCKYGIHCTFAHGDQDLRKKEDNIFSMNNPMMMVPMFYDMNGMPIMMTPPPGTDLSKMQQMMAAGNMNPNQFMMMNPMQNAQMGMNNIENNNNEPKDDLQQ